MAGALAPIRFEPGVRSKDRIELTRWAPLRRLLRWRGLQPLVVIVNAAFFSLIIAAGIVGTPVGNRNFAIIFVWIVWWALLIVLLIPFGARAWCMACPLPVVGEWAQRGAILRRSPLRAITRGMEWPARLRNIWPQNVAFLGVALFSAVILTTPVVTALMLGGFVVAAVASSLLFRRRAFCRFICPVGGFIGLYSMAAPLEVRVKDPAVCLKHCGNECVVGSSQGYGCPWMEYPGTLERNAYCGMCTECFKTCPTGNVALNLRPFGADLMVPVRHLDESFKGFIMLAAALVYSAVMLGPWSVVKDAAFLGNGNGALYAGYVGAFLFTMIIAFPGLFVAAGAAGKLVSRDATMSVRKFLAGAGYATVPLGLAGWIAFSFSFILINGSYVLPVISDPFGWGWNLLGTADVAWTPIRPDILPYLQVPAIALGLFFSIRVAMRVVRENTASERHARRAAIPFTALLTLVAFAFLVLYL